MSSIRSRITAGTNFPRYYVLARLVMNRHLYGSPNGLPLDSLVRPTWAGSWEHGPLWTQDPSARIYQDQLILRVTHALEGRATTVRVAIDKGRYGICMHVATDPVDLNSPITRSELQRIAQLRKPHQARQDVQLRACQDVPGSCQVCLTDYITTVGHSKVREVFESENGVSVHFSSAYRG